MRVASWAVVICALIGATGLFLPSFELEIRGIALGRRASLSLYQAHEDRAFVRKMLGVYRRSKARSAGEAITGAKLGDRIKSHFHLDDAHDALTSLDEISDEDIHDVGTILAIVIWSFLALELIVAGLVFLGTVRGSHRKAHVIGALVTTVVVVAVAIAIHIACREVAWEANDDLGAGAVGLAAGAYAIPIAAVGGLVAAIALVVQLRRGPVAP